MMGEYMENQMDDLIQSGIELRNRYCEIIVHSLGIKQKGDKPYRNYFFTGKDSSDYYDLENMVKAGLMVKRKDYFNQVSESFIYQVTDKGKELIGIGR